MHGWRPEIESALCLRLPRLLKQRNVLPGCQTAGVLHWRDSSGREYGSVGYRADLGDEAGTLVLDYKAGEQVMQDTIALTSIPVSFGGRNWFMHCPYSGRRARCLYKWPRLPGFRHREAVHPKPTYASQRDSGMVRVTRQRWALREKMGDRISDLFGEPHKPKWMRWATYDHFAARDAELEAVEAAHMGALLARLAR
ncbi:hypothetical protein MASR1M8_11500 [Thermomonas brevis]